MKEVYVTPEMDIVTIECTEDILKDSTPIELTNE